MGSETTLSAGAEFSVDVLLNAIGTSNLAHTLASIHDDNPLIYVNEAFLDETGYSREEVIGRNCRFLQGEDTDPGTIEIIKQALKDYTPLDIDVLNYRKDGSSFLNRLRITTVFDHNNEPVAYMGIQSNTDRLVEQARAAQVKYKMESLGRLSANISHEIKNALQPIRLMLESLEDWHEMRPEQVNQCVTIAMDNMLIVENVIKDVLHFSKQTDTTRKSVPINILAQNIVRFAQTLAPKTATIDTLFSDALLNDSHTTLVNQSGIYQIISNLVNNALDATNKQGKVQISADIIRKETCLIDKLKEGDYLEISIKDDGTGIDKDAYENIFQPFFSTKSPGEGTGLGLAISQKIIREHGGALSASNNEDMGATFTLYLPITAQSQAEK